MSRMLKALAPDEGSRADLWRKVVEVGGDSRADFDRELQLPPLSPSRFTEELARKVFTNAADHDVVAKLYRDTLQDGFGGLTALHYPQAGWGDLEVQELGQTLTEIQMSDVEDLDLRGNGMTTLEPIGAAIQSGALQALRVLILSSIPLATLPDAISQLRALRRLDLDGTSLAVLPDTFWQLSLETLDVHGASLVALPNTIGQMSSLRTLRAGNTPASRVLPDTIGQLGSLHTLDLHNSTVVVLPDAIGQLISLHTLDLRGCTSLLALPASCGQLASLRLLLLMGLGNACCLVNQTCCTRSIFSNLTQREETEALRHLPDLSQLPQLEVRRLPAHLARWDACGRRAYTEPLLSTIFRHRWPRIRCVGCYASTLITVVLIAWLVAQLFSIPSQLARNSPPPPPPLLAS